MLFEDSTAQSRLYISDWVFHQHMLCVVDARASTSGQPAVLLKRLTRSDSTTSHYKTSTRKAATAEYRLLTCRWLIIATSYDDIFDEYSSKK